MCAPAADSGGNRDRGEVSCGGAHRGKALKAAHRFTHPDRAAPRGFYLVVRDRALSGDPVKQSA
jgi:hypothetical protein